jgi:hypothetical protein
MNKLTASIGALAAALFGGSALAGTPDVARSAKPANAVVAPVGGWSYHREGSASASDGGGIMLVGNSSIEQQLQQFVEQLVQQQQLE